MPFLRLGEIWLPLCAASLMAVMAITPEAQAQPAGDARCGTEFIGVTPEISACGFTLSDTGKLIREGKTLADPLVASYESGANGEKPIVASRVVLFPPSPSGRFRILQACDGNGQSAICWSVFVLDGKTGKLHKTFAGHYGPEHWQSWSPDQQHVVLADTDEGAWWLHVIEPTTGNGREFPDFESQENWVVQPETLRWTDPRSFTVTVQTCGDCQPAQKTIRF